MRDEPFATWSSVRGWNVSGVWPASSGVGHNYVRCLDRSQSQNLLVTGDKNGLVKLFNYPCVNEGSAFKEYRCHSSFVQGTKFTFQDKYMVSTGGLKDCSIALWRVKHCKCDKCIKFRPKKVGTNGFASKVNLALHRKETEDHQDALEGATQTFHASAIEALHSKKESSNSTLATAVKAARDEKDQESNETVISSKPKAKQ